MTQFCVNIADADVSRVVAAMCDTYGYHVMVDNPDFDPSEEEGPDNPRQIPNPETPNELANRKTRDFLMEVTVSHELKNERNNLPQPTPPNITDPAE